MRLDAFFRACVRLHGDPDGRDELVAAARELEDSESLLTAIEAQQVGPLLHRMIGDAGILSPMVANAVRDSYHRTARRTLLLFDELAACLRALGAVGVPVIVLKGAADSRSE